MQLGRTLLLAANQSHAVPCHGHAAGACTASDLGLQCMLCQLLMSMQAVITQWLDSAARELHWNKGLGLLIGPKTRRKSRHSSTHFLATGGCFIQALCV